MRLKQVSSILVCTMIGLSIPLYGRERTEVVRSLLSSCVMLHHDSVQREAILEEMKQVNGEPSSALCERMLVVIQQLIADRWCSEEQLKKLQIAHDWLHAKLNAMPRRDSMLNDCVNDEKNFSIVETIASLLHMVQVAHDRLAELEQFVEAFNSRLSIIEKALELLNAQGQVA